MLQDQDFHSFQDNKQKAIKIPKLTASNAELEPWRIQRLKRIVGELNSFVYNHYKLNLMNKLLCLHDDNGTLKITWSSDPTLAERTVVREVWSETAQSEDYRVHHLA